MNDIISFDGATSDLARQLKDSYDELVCLECRETVPAFLSFHVWKRHGMKLDEYREKYPDAPVMTAAHRAKLGQSHAPTDAKDPIGVDGAFEIRDGATEKVTCRVCGVLKKNLAPHVPTHGYTSAEYREEFPAAPITWAEYRDEPAPVAFGMFPWERVDCRRDVLLDNKDWLLDVEQSWLLGSETIFDRMVEVFNANADRQLGNFRHKLAASMVVAVQEDLPHVSVREVATELDIDRDTLHNEIRRMPAESTGIRTPEQVIQNRPELHDSVDEVLVELDSYPDAFKYSGRTPETAAALTTWRVLQDDGVTQAWACELFGITPAALRNARDTLEDYR